MLVTNQTRNGNCLYCRAFLCVRVSASSICDCGLRLVIVLASGQEDERKMVMNHGSRIGKVYHQNLG